MHDARDAEDTRLLEAGEYSALVEGYYGVILDRSRIKVRREDDAIAVAAEVAIRLLSELKPPPPLPRALPGRRPPSDQVEGQGVLRAGQDLDEVELRGVAPQCLHRVDRRV